MTDPLRALFTTHLPRLTGPALSGYLEHNNLPSSPTWTDDEGRQWTLLDRLVEFMLTTRPTAALQRAFIGQLREESTFPATLPKWNKASEEDKRARARLWLAIQRVGEDVPHVDRLEEFFGKRFEASFAGKPAGWPASGWGESGDGGWLAYALEELDAARARSAPQASDWSDTLARWMDASLLGSSRSPRHRWWGYGSVAKTTKAKNQVGDRGWEKPGVLPNAPDWAFRNTTARPEGLPTHWSRLMAGLLGRMADGMRQSGELDATRTLHLEEVVKESPLGGWMTADMQKALVDLAQAGLLADSSSSPAPRWYDGRSLCALGVLIRHNPKGGWADEDIQNQLVSAVLGHQKALESSPHPHERAMARLVVAPAASSAFLWASAQPESVQSTAGLSGLRPSRPGP